MKTILFLSLVLFNVNQLKAQTNLFDDEMGVISYMEGKYFYNADNGLTVSYGYLGNYNTYGIKVTNKGGSTFYFINVNVEAYGSFGDLYGMSPSDGSNFGFRVYKGKLIVGRGEEGETTFYLK